MYDVLLYGDQATIFQFVIVALLYTWGIGLSIPLFIRYILIRKPINRGVATVIALLNSALFWFISFLEIQARSASGNPSPVWIVVFFVARWLMSRGIDQKSNVAINLNNQNVNQPTLHHNRNVNYLPFILLVGFVCGVLSVLLIGSFSDEVIILGPNESRENEITSMVNDPILVPTVNAVPTNTKTPFPVINHAATVEVRQTTTVLVAKTATASAIATADTVSNLVNTWAQDTSQIFGPESQTLNVEAEDADLPYWYSGVEVRDFFAEVTFFNPVRSSAQRWGYGFGFRATQSGTYRLHVDDNRNWYLTKVYLSDNAEPRFELIANGVVSPLDTRSEARNTLLLVTQNTKGYFFVNQSYVATLDLSGIGDAGDVWVASGFHTENIVQGRATRFENFSVWELK